MSLLLDALKRAEQEKRARQGEGSAPTPTLRDAVPAAVPVPPRASAPASGLELQPMGHGQASNATLGVAPRGDAHTAQTVFQAKAANGDAPKSRGMIFATIGAVVVVAIAASAYVWYSVNALAPRQAATNVRPRPIAAPVPPPAGAPPAFSPAGEGPLANSAVTAALTATPDPARTAQLSAPASTATPAPIIAPPRLRPAEEAAANLLRDAAPAPTTEPLRLDRSPDAGRQVPADIANGYDQLRQGNLAAARRSYDAALSANPSNLDALLGVATVEARSGSRTSAAVFYRRALDVDPRNATALAGLAALADSARPDAVEAQLRSDLARSPESSALHFTLGNVLAGQSRWHEAQTEYFEAHRLDPGSPEVLFNLAVSLDRLGQSRVAAGFYTRALDAVRGQSAPFDATAVRRRLEELR